MNCKDKAMNNKTRNELMSTEVYTTTFSFEDIYSSLDEEQQEIIDNLSDEELSKFINDNKDSFERGMESGVLYEWSVPAQEVGTDALERMKGETITSGCNND